MVCFHPKREGLLAFGTEDGKVAVFDVCSNKSAITSVTFHTRTVYSLSWGPEPPEHSTINEGEIGQTQPEIEINAKVMTPLKVASINSGALSSLVSCRLIYHTICYSS